MTTYLAIIDSDLSSRRSAAALRAELLKQLAEQVHVEIDLSKVESISSSYADELFGVVAQKLGLEHFLKSVRFVGARPEVIRSIAAAIRYRLETALERPEIGLALLVAKRFAEKRAA